MTQHAELERALADWLHEQPEWSAPTYIEEVLDRTRGTRQRSRWSSLGWWLPIGLPRRDSLRAVGRPLVVLILLATLIGALLSAGARPRLPAPFGPAGNGAILYGTPEGDLATLDTATGRTSSLVATTSWDETPDFSHDGTRVIFARRADPGDGWILMVAGADGTGARALTGVIDPTWNVWSPDDSRVAVIDAGSTPPTLEVYSADGSSRTVLEIDGLTPISAAFSRDGSELLFLGADAGMSGLYAVDAAARTAPRTIVAPVAGAQTITNPVLSPDGSTWAYTRWDDGRSIIHLIDLPSATDRPMQFDLASDGENTATWTPDGRLIYHRHLAGMYRLAVAPVDGSVVTLLGPAYPEGTGGASVVVSPDGREAIVTYQSDGSHWLLDLSGGPGTRLDLPATATFSWQRVAP